jgi:sulfide:quinone oxidoreductase
VKPRVVIAGAGVGGLETLLALRALLGEAVRVEVVAPDDEFSYRQFAVAEPFSLGEIARFGLGELIEDAGGVHRRDRLAAVDREARYVRTSAGAEIPYHSLVIAIGAHQVVALPGALTYRGPASNRDVHQAVLKLARGESRGIAFAVPATVHWGLPAYELALLAAAHLADVGAGGAPVHLATAEGAPLDAFGETISDRVRAELDRAGVTLHTTAPARVVEGGLALVDGTVIPCDHAVALPAPRIEAIDGLPQGRHGFLETDFRMRIDGCANEYAVGDASWFPIKQGGLAAQQADSAASCIAHELAPDVKCAPFVPRLRAALLTGDGPLYLRSGAGLEIAASEAPLWWPPGKVAGRYLTPFIARHASSTNQPDPALLDLPAADPGGVTGHREAIELALYAADADARLSDYDGALRWLAVAERLELTLPAEYALRREQWRRLAA